MSFFGGANGFTVNLSRWPKGAGAPAGYAFVTTNNGQNYVTTNNGANRVLVRIS